MVAPSGRGCVVAMHPDRDDPLAAVHDYIDRQPRYVILPSV